MVFTHSLFSMFCMLLQASSPTTLGDAMHCRTHVADMQSRVVTATSTCVYPGNSKLLAQVDVVWV